MLTLTTVFLIGLVSLGTCQVGDPDGVRVIRSVVKGDMVLTADHNGVIREYTANTTTQPYVGHADQWWYIQKSSYYPADDIQLRLVRTRGSNDYNHVDVELPPGSYYSYRNDWRMIPTKRKDRSFGMEWYSQRSFGVGSGLCLQNNGERQFVSLEPCRLNKREQQWRFNDP